MQSISRRRISQVQPLKSSLGLTDVAIEPGVRHARPAVGLQSAAKSGRVVAGVEGGAASGDGRVGRASLHRGVHAQDARLALVVRVAGRQEDGARVFA